MRGPRRIGLIKPDLESDHGRVCGSRRFLESGFGNSGDTIPNCGRERVGLRLCHGKIGAGRGRGTAASRDAAGQPAAAGLFRAGGLSALSGPVGQALRGGGRRGLGLLPDAQPRASDPGSGGRGWPARGAR